MALTQMQIIQSLGDAMSWFERELNWDVPPGELRHLCGRIGELYAALITNGQMANEVNQHGYDVVSGDGERVSAKTTTMMGLNGHLSFNLNTIDQVDRVIILRVNTAEMQIETLLDASVSKAKKLIREDKNNRASIHFRDIIKKPKKYIDLKTVKEVEYDVYKICELENGTITIQKNGVEISPVKPELRVLAKQFNISLLNSNGNKLNTRQLGSQVIKTIEEFQSDS